MTGGAAWGRLSDSRFLQQNATFVIPPVSTAGSASSAFWRGGWVIGAGVETALAGNWTAKLEYLYMDLGHTTDTFTVILPGFLGPPFPFATTTSSQIRDNIIRAGLNYRFGPSNTDPAAASGGGYYKAPPQAVAAAHNWSGFYAGANAGYTVGRDPSSETDLGLAGITPPNFSTIPSSSRRRAGSSAASSATIGKAAISCLAPRPIGNGPIKANQPVSRAAPCRPAASR